MNASAAQALIAGLENTASTLVAAPNIERLLANLDGLSPAVSELCGLLEDRELSVIDKAHFQNSLRDCLLHLQRALLYTHSRLQHEHRCLRTQLTELSAQLQWAQRSHESL